MWVSSYRIMLKQNFTDIACLTKSALPTERNILENHLYFKFRKLILLLKVPTYAWSGIPNTQYFLYG